MTKAYCYMICRGYNKTSKRFKRRNRRPRFTCKAEHKFYLFMDNFKPPLYTVDQVIKELIPCLAWLKRYYENVSTKKHSKELACYGSGFDSYGYDNVLSDLYYITDRWSCDWRVRWIINLLDKEYNYDASIKKTETKT